MRLFDKLRLKLRFPPMIYSTLFVKEKTPYLEKSEIFLLYVVVIQGYTKHVSFMTMVYLKSSLQHLRLADLLWVTE